MPKHPEPRAAQRASKYWFSPRVPSGSLALFSALFYPFLSVTLALPSDSLDFAPPFPSQIPHFRGRACSVSRSAGLAPSCSRKVDLVNLTFRRGAPPGWHRSRHLARCNGYSYKYIGGKSEWSATGLAASLGRRFSPLADGCIRGVAALGAAAASLSHTSGLRAVHGQRRRDVDILFLRVHIQMATSSLSGYE